MATDFPGAFAALREIMKRHSAGMIVQTDTPTDFTVITRAIHPNKKPLFFGAVLWKKSAVTYHLFSLYVNQSLQGAISPELLRRKQGKTCFNFQRPDPELFSQLDALTQRGREQWERHGFLKPGPISYEQLEAMYRTGGGDPEALAKRRKKIAKQAAAKRAGTLKRKAAKTDTIPKTVKRRKSAR